MNIEKAIEILTHMSKSTNVASLEACVQAIQLGIEALKARKIWQDEEGFDPAESLLGETED